MICVYLNMQSLMIWAVVIGVCFAYSLNVQQEIENTKHLINLYQRKLDILQKMNSHSSPDLTNDYIPYHSQPLFKAQEQGVWEIKTSFDRGAQFVPPAFIVSGSNLEQI